VIFSFCFWKKSPKYGIIIVGTKEYQILVSALIGGKDEALWLVPKER